MTITTVGILNITYHTSSDEEATVSLFLPNEVDRIIGDCSLEGVASLLLTFSEFTLHIIFRKTSDSEEWYISKI